VPQIGTLTARLIGERGLSMGDRVRLRPDPARIHRFDREGKAIRA
jgi:multiple sugar transport system ATP-binding protein